MANTTLDSLAAAAEERVGKQKTLDPFTVLGTNPKQSASGSLYEDFLPQLRGQQGFRTLREMVSNDATIGAVIYAMEMLLREVSWNGVPDDETLAADVDAAVFLDECKDDMEHTFPDFIAQALSVLPFGFSLFETVYGRRLLSEGSRFDDGRIRWAQFAPRPQESISRFVYQDGRLFGFEQFTQHGPVVIPMVKALHFVTDSTRPEGRSILRPAYLAWYYKKYATEQMMIGMQRDLAGMPVAWIPAENMIAQDTTYDLWRKIVTRVVVL